MTRCHIAHFAAFPTPRPTGCAAHCPLPGQAGLSGQGARLAGIRSGAWPDKRGNPGRGRVWRDSGRGVGRTSGVIRAEAEGRGGRRPRTGRGPDARAPPPEVAGAPYGEGGCCGRVRATARRRASGAGASAPGRRPGSRGPRRRAPRRTRAGSASRRAPRRQSPCCPPSR